MLRHAGKLALVTGGSNGIGQAIVRRLAAEGAQVAIADLADSSATVDLVHRDGGAAFGVKCDLSRESDIQDCVSTVQDKAGNAQIFVHCAAVQFVRPFSELSSADWRLTQAVNQESVFHFLKGLQPGMQAAGWGRIILIASSTFYINSHHMSHYVTSKGALMGLAHGLANELGTHGITINCIAPGLTKTPNAVASLPEDFFSAMAAQQAIKRSGTPEDQAGIVSFMASDDAGFITGQTLLADGGQGRT